MKSPVALSVALATVALARVASADLPPPSLPPVTADLRDPPLVGIKDELIYLRDPRDVIRLYPHGQLDLDAHTSYGAGVDTLRASDAGTDLSTRFFVRRARLDLAGEVVKRIAFDAGIDLVANPAIDGARADGTTTHVALADAWAKLDAGRGLGLTLGVFQAPFSLESRTAVSELAMLERNVAIRGFVMPGGKSLGASVGGSTQHATLSWDVGAFGATAVAPNDFEQRFDAVGRVVTRPFAGGSGILQGAQLGVSARAGTRHARDVTDDAPAVTTGQGFALWRPTYADSLGRVAHVIPSSLEWSAGGELRVPVHGVVFRGEGYYVARDTRESTDGGATTDRTGAMTGVGWYAELSAWPMQIASLVAEPPPPRESPHADHLELARGTTLSPERRGIELAVLGAGIHANYDGASRSGVTDARGPARAIQLYQIGAAINYWHSSHLRFSLNGNLYYAPASGSFDNAAVVPGNLGSPAYDSSAHTLVELGGRASLMF